MRPDNCLYANRSGQHNTEVKCDNKYVEKTNIMNGTYPFLYVIQLFRNG